jgi:hypothetical protein
MLLGDVRAEIARVCGQLTVYLRAAAAGTPRLLPAAEIGRVARKFSGYGQQAPR